MCIIAPYIPFFFINDIKLKREQTLNKLIYCYNLLLNNKPEETPGSEARESSPRYSVVIKTVKTVQMEGREAGGGLG